MRTLNPSQVNTRSRPAGRGPGRALAKGRANLPARSTSGVINSLAILRRLAFILVSSVTVVSGIVAVQNGYLDQTQKVIAALWAEVPDLPKIPIKEIEVIGVQYLDPAEVIAAAGPLAGQSILAVSLKNIRANVVALGWVKDATIVRQLPNKLLITVAERQGYALWQHQDILRLIDRDGVEITREKLTLFAGLPLVVGKGAPEKVAELSVLLESEPALMPFVISAVRVGERRWNIQMRNGAEVMLPEHHAQLAWKRLAELQQQHGLLHRDIVSLDLRIPDRLTIRPNKGAELGKRKDLNT